MRTPEPTGKPPLADSRATDATGGRRRLLLDTIAVCLAVATTLAIVLPPYARRPFWFDELVSLEIASLGPRPFLEYVFTVEANGLLYHALLGLWLAVGDDEATVRALSIVFALGTLPFLYALALRLFDRRTAVYAVLLMGVNVSYVGFARDARSYALALLLVTASSLFLVRAAEESHPRDWALYAVTAALAVWAHLFAGLVVAAHVLWLLVERRTVTRRRALLAVGAVGVLLLPLVAAIGLSGQGGQLDWLRRPGLRQLPGLLEWFVEDPVTLAVYFAGGLVGLAAALVEWRRDSGRRPRAQIFLLLWLLLPPLLAFAISYATAPVYLYRYFLVCLPALVLLASAGLARLRPVWLGAALVAGALPLSAGTAAACQPYCKIRLDDWEAAAAYVEARSLPGDAILFYPAEVRTPLAHYLEGERPRLLFPARWDLLGGAAEGAATLDAAMRTVGRHRRVWLVTWWLPSQPARAALESRATLLTSREYQGNVHVELYRPR